MKLTTFTFFFLVINLSSVQAWLTNNDNECTLSDFHNIIWQLELDESYASFYLIFEDTTEYTGYDGCNWFFGTYTLQGDTIVTEDLVQTMRACDGVKTFLLWHLQKPLKCEITGKELFLKNEEVTMIYRSDYTKAVINTPLADNNWYLQSSTHSGLNELSGKDIPVISFNEEREYEIRWNCTDANLFGCNRYAGYWGKGENDRITFYRRSTKVSGASHASTMTRLEKVDSFAIIDDKLILKENEDTWHTFTSQPTSADQEDFPISYQLQQNYPNPFNPSTQIHFAIPEQAHIRLTVYDLLGQQVAVLVNEVRPPGWHGATFDATGLSSGTFIYRLEAGNHVESRSMLFLK